jgi:decaprenylphospho-beta-D-erythro-pentofuranosid-2-ulose 2-reductase
MPEGTRKVLIVGATSAIAEALARRLAARGDSLLLAGRDATRLDAIAADLRVRGAPQAHVGILDVARSDEHARFVDDAWRTHGPFDIALLAHGTLPDQKACEASVERTLAELNVNLIGTVSLLTLLANRMQERGSGTLGVITSVAGDRGRQSNYVYGAAKGGVSLFLQGLRHRLAPVGVKVVDIKPGFVDTPMTAAFAKGGLWATPAQVAKDIERALDRSTAVLYTPWFWRGIMGIVRALPNALFHRTRL